MLLGHKMCVESQCAETERESEIQLVGAANDGAYCSNAITLNSLPKFSMRKETLLALRCCGFLCKLWLIFPLQYTRVWVFFFK